MPFGISLIQVKNMNNLKSFSRPLTWSALILLAAFAGGCGGGGNHGGGSNPAASAGPTGGTCAGAACVNLGTAANYSILAETGVSTTGTTSVNGNVGLSPNGKVGLTGWSQADDVTNTYATSAYVVAPGKLYAANHSGGTTTNDLTVAVGDKDAAYTAAQAKPAGPCPGVGNFGGQVLPAGVYTCAVAVTIPTATNLTLNGSATDVWVFQITGTVTQAASTQVILTGGALPKNVFWQVTDVVTIEPSAVMQGVILGFSTIRMQAGATINGRLLGNTDVTLISNTVTLP